MRLCAPLPRHVRRRATSIVEMQDHGLEPQKQLNEIYRRLSRRHRPSARRCPTTCTISARTTPKRTRCCCACRREATSTTPSASASPPPSSIFKTPEEMRALFPDDTGALENTVAIAERCDVQMAEGALHLPRFPLPDGFASNSDYLRHLAYEGARARYGEVDRANPRPPRVRVVGDREDGFRRVLPDRARHRRLRAPLRTFRWGRGAAARPEVW